MLYWGSRILQLLSPLGWIAGGVVLALSFPAVRKRLRSAAVAATAGVMSATDNIGDMVRDKEEEDSTYLQDVQGIEVHSEDVDSEPIKAGHVTRRTRTKTTGI
ncbi:hypothetical protein [Sporomusa aerivorans]|uniref:hypothetical protein n=1 Tax=Sporomusa aerivorans TaxID=204936 RepID=UPI00352AD2E7